MKDEPFEKYWQKQFEHFETQPSEGLWDKMSHELLVRHAKMLFNHYLVKPEAYVWRKIAFILWIKNFFRFSFSTFNVYYLLTALLMVFSIYNIIHIQENKSSSNSTSNVNERLTFTPNDVRSIQPWLKQQELSILKKDSDQFNTKPVKLNKKPDFIANSHSNEFTSLYQNDIESWAPLKTQTINNVGTIALEENQISPYMQDFKLHYHAAWSFYVAPISPIVELNFKTLSDEKQKSNYQPLASQVFSNLAFSVYYEWQRFNFKFQTGVVYSSFKQNYRFNDAVFYNDTLHHQQIIDNSYYNYSYIQVLNLDSLLLTGDTVWFTYIDSTLVPMFDTLNTTEIQNIRKNKSSQQQYKLSVLEIPFIAGYSYSLGKLDLTLKAGTSLNYTLLTKGYMPSENNDYGVQPLKREHMQNFYINIIAGAEANYFITDKLSLSFMPLYRRNLTRLFKNDMSIRLQLQSWTFNIGLKYQFK